MGSRLSLAAVRTEISFRPIETSIVMQCSKKLVFHPLTNNIRDNGDVLIIVRSRTEDPLDMKTSTTGVALMWHDVNELW